MHLLATATAFCSDYRPIPAELVWVNCRYCPDNNWQLALAFFLTRDNIVQSLGALEYPDVVMLGSDLSRLFYYYVRSMYSVLTTDIVWCDAVSPLTIARDSRHNCLWFLVRCTICINYYLSLSRAYYIHIHSYFWCQKNFVFLKMRLSQLLSSSVLVSQSFRKKLLLINPVKLWTLEIF